MSAIESRLEEMGLSLPEPLTAPLGVKLPFELVRVRAGLAYISGHGPFDGDRLLVTGSVGTDVSVEEAYEAARATGLSILASLKQSLGDLDRVTGWVKALGFVKGGEGFNVTPAPERPREPASPNSHARRRNPPPRAGGDDDHRLGYADHLRCAYSADARRTRVSPRSPAPIAERA